MTPEVRVLRGAPDDLELAALMAGIAAGTMAVSMPVRDRGRADREAGARRRWCDAAPRLRSPLTRGPDAWRWSARA